MSRHAIVIGAKGFVGSAIVAEARKRGWSVSEVDVDTYEQQRGSTADVLINANGNSKKFLSREDPGLDFDLSVRSTARVLQDFPCARHVHLSTIDVYPDVHHPEANAEEAPIAIEDLSPYGAHKYLAEQLVRHFASDWLILRMGGFVGPGLRKNSIYDLLTGAPLWVHPDSRYQYQHTGFLARTLFDLLDTPCRKEIFNCAGAGTVSLREAAAWLGTEPVSIAEDGVPEHYEVNLDKLSNLIDIPSSQNTVQQFLSDVQRNQVVLS